MLHILTLHFNAPEAFTPQTTGKPVTFQPGYYVAEYACGQQPGWYSLFAVDEAFQKRNPAEPLATVGFEMKDGKLYIV